MSNFICYLCSLSACRGSRTLSKAQVQLSQLRKKFAKNLKQIRLDKGMTQEELAEKLEINLRYVQQLEEKNTPNVKLDTLEKLAKVFKTPSQ